MTGLRVMLVDDDGSFLHGVHRLLEQAGHSLFAAHCGHWALSELAAY